jgi:hypothetical protein
MERENGFTGNGEATRLVPLKKAGRGKEKELFVD